MLSELPNRRTALWRSLRLGYELHPRLFLASLLLGALSFIPLALTSLWLKLLADSVLSGRGWEVALAAGLIGGSVALGWLLTTLGVRVSTSFRLLAAAGAQGKVARLHAGTPGIEHLENPDMLDRLQLLRESGWLLDHLYGTFSGILGIVLMLLTTVGLLASVHPLMIGLALFAIPAAAAGSWRAGAEREALDRYAPHDRLAKHLFDIGTTAGPGKDIRVTRTTELVVSRRREAWNAGRRYIHDVVWGNAWFFAATWLLFGLAYSGALAFAVLGLHRSPGSVLLLLTAGGSLARYLGTAIGYATFLNWTLTAAARLAWLENYTRDRAERAPLDAPQRLQTGIRLEAVSFTYPGSDRRVLENISLELPAGSVVAVVGENGAGKTTLVKLLCKFYEPTSGQILVDGVDLAQIKAGEWRSRLAGAFQDFMRFEYRAQSTVGLGEREREPDLEAVGAAVKRGGAQDVVARLPAGLQTQLGPTWEEGVELSFGQWQKLALARGFMRERPLLLVLDEPTAALDAETEHALFERFAAESRNAAEDGRITVLVSHRFSTVRMADVIVVLDGARLVEYGSHDELVRRGGLYAELYGIQARGYR